MIALQKIYLINWRTWIILLFSWWAQFHKCFIIWGQSLARLNIHREASAFYSLEGLCFYQLLCCSCMTWCAIVLQKWLCVMLSIAFTGIRELLWLWIHLQTQLAALIHKDCCNAALVFLVLWSGRQSVLWCTTYRKWICSAMKWLILAISVLLSVVELCVFSVVSVLFSAVDTELCAFFCIWCWAVHFQYRFSAFLCSWLELWVFSAIFSAVFCIWCSAVCFKCHFGSFFYIWLWVVHFQCHFSAFLCMFTPFVLHPFSSHQSLVGECSLRDDADSLSYTWTWR